MKFHEYIPHEILREDVKCLWVLETEYPPDGFEDVVPDGCVELICNLGSPYHSPETGAGLPAGFIVGFQNRTLRFPVSGTVKVVAARFHPWGALALLHDRIDTVTNSVAGLGPQWSAVVAELGPIVARGEYERAAMRLQAYLIERALARSFDPGIVKTAAKLLDTTKGQYRIEELAEQCQISVRQLQRTFQKMMGTTPKGFARAIRFAAAQRAILFDSKIDLTRLAYQCGYSDQAHFIRDFKEIAGKTPGEYAREVDRLRAILKSRDVVFLQSADALTD
jgi:AraC-like DNA-binding protein